MTPRIPISSAKRIADQHACRQVIIVAWDGERTHVVTYGKTLEECDQAALGGDRVKTALGWPDALLGAVPSRVKALQRRVAELEAKLAEPVRPCADCGAASCCGYPTASEHYGDCIHHDPATCGRSSCVARRAREATLRKQIDSTNHESSPTRSPRTGA